MKKIELTKKTAVVFMFLAAIGLGTIGILIKKIDGNIPTITISFLRVFIALVFLFPILPFIDKTTFKIKKRDIKQYMIIGFLIALASGLYNAAYLFAPVQNVVIINYTYPFFVIIFARFLLKERITKTKIISATIAMVGLIIINPFHIDSNMLGNFLALGAGITTALLITKERQQDEIHGIGSVLWYLIFASLLLSPSIFIRGFGSIGEVWVYILILGLVSTGLSYILFNLSLEKLEAEIGSIIAMTTTPLISILLAVLFVGETINTRTLIGGGILIIAGLYLQINKKKYISLLQKIYKKHKKHNYTRLS